MIQPPGPYLAGDGLGSFASEPGQVTTVDAKGVPGADDLRSPPGPSCGRPSLQPVLSYGAEGEPDPNPELGYRHARLG